MGHKDQDPRIKYYDFTNGYLALPNGNELPLPAPVEINVDFPGLKHRANNRVEVPLAAIELEHIRPNDRQQLVATVNWELSGTIVLAALLGSSINISLAPTANIVFTLWRDAVGINHGGFPVASFTDTGTGGINVEVDILTTTVPFKVPVTTTITATDTGAKKGTHKYFLTAAADSVGLIDVNIANVVKIELFEPTVGLLPGIHFSGMVIDENK